MLSKILMPSGGQTTDELVILQWEKKIGDFVRRGDILFEIETDKANLTVESFAEGTLLEICYGDGAHVRAGEVVAYVGEPTDTIPSKYKNERASLEKTEPSEDNSARKNSRDDKERIPVTHDSRIRASPLARSQARVENIRLDDVARFVSKKLLKKNDIAKYLDHIRNGRGEETADAYLVDVTPMRKTIAKRMRESVLQSPHYFISADIDMTNVVRLRRRLNDSITDVQLKISYNDFIMKVVAKAIGDHPFINSTFLGDHVKVYKNVNIGLATAVQAGLVVPVIKNVNLKSLSEIAVARAELTEKVRNGKISERDISGGTITLSNLGMYGMKEFTAIINQPESSILAVGAIIETPVAVKRKLKVRDIMNMTASFDHRVIDGAVGAAFLQQVKKLLENPDMLVL